MTATVEPIGEDFIHWKPAGIPDVQSEDTYGLTVTPGHVNVAVGAKPTFTCSIGRAANFLIEHPIKWERHGRDGSKEVISVLANVETVLNTEYNVQLIRSPNNDGMSFSLTFLEGIKNKYDGFFKCVLYHNDTLILAQKKVEVHVIKMFSKMEFKLATKKEVNVGNRPMDIRLEEGTYNSLCKTEGSNPAADIKIFLDDVKQTSVITALEDKDRKEPPQAWNVQNTITLTLKQMDKNKILKCVAMVNEDKLMKKEMSYKLDVYSVQQSEDTYVLTVTPGQVNVAVGAKPTFTCSIGRASNYLIEHPIKWERHGRDGSKEVISVLDNVETVFNTEYNVQLITSGNNDDAMSFSLKFLQGIKNKYDGFFKCVLYHNDTLILAQKKVEVHVIKMFSKMEFKIDTKKQVNVGNPPMDIRLEEGTYNSLCKTEGSNPAADIKIFLDDVKQTSAITSLEDKDRKEPPQVWNVQNTITLTLKQMDKNKILKCVAMVNEDKLMKKELSYKLDVYSVPPEITCGNFSAVSGDKFAKMECSIELKGIKCTDDILWQNGNNGEQFKINTTHKGYKVFCENVNRNTVKTIFRITAVGISDFETDFFVIYKDKHGTTTRHVANLHQDHSSASSIQYGIYLMCSTILAATLLL